MTLRKSKTATRWMTLVRIGGETPAGVSFFWPAADWRPWQEFRFVKRFQHFSAKMRPTRSNVRIPKTQRAGEGRPGPIFRSVYPICKFFATSSDLSYALKNPVKPGASQGRSGTHHMPIYSIQTSRRGGGRSVKICFFNIITYFFIKVKHAA
jgi:hypothetical protein